MSDKGSEKKDENTGSRSDQEQDERALEAHYEEVISAFTQRAHITSRTNSESTSRNISPERTQQEEDEYEEFEARRQAIRASRSREKERLRAIRLQWDQEEKDARAREEDGDRRRESGIIDPRFREELENARAEREWQHRLQRVREEEETRIKEIERRELQLSERKQRYVISRVIILKTNDEIKKEAELEEEYQRLFNDARPALEAEAERIRAQQRKEEEEYQRRKDEIEEEENRVWEENEKQRQENLRALAQHWSEKRKNRAFREVKRRNIPRRPRRDLTEPDMTFIPAGTARENQSSAARKEDEEHKTLVPNRHTNAPYDNGKATRERNSTENQQQQPGAKLHPTEEKRSAQPAGAEEKQEPGARGAIPRPPAVLKKYKIPQSEYNKKLRTSNRKFREGKINEAERRVAAGRGVRSWSPKPTDQEEIRRMKKELEEMCSENSDE